MKPFRRWNVQIELSNRIRSKVGIIELKRVSIWWFYSGPIGRPVLQNGVFVSREPVSGLRHEYIRIWRRHMSPNIYNFPIQSQLKMSIRTGNCWQLLDVVTLSRRRRSSTWSAVVARTMQLVINLFFGSIQSNSRVNDLERSLAWKIGREIDKWNTWMVTK